MSFLRMILGVNPPQSYLDSVEQFAKATIAAVGYDRAAWDKEIAGQCSYSVFVLDSTRWPEIPGIIHKTQASAQASMESHVRMKCREICRNNTPASWGLVIGDAQRPVLVSDLSIDAEKDDGIRWGNKAGAEEAKKYLESAYRAEGIDVKVELRPFDAPGNEIPEKLVFDPSTQEQSDDWFA